MWDPPDRLIRRTWARFRGRSQPMRALGVLVCVLIGLASFALCAAILFAVLAGPIFLLAELL